MMNEDENQHSEPLTHLVNVSALRVGGYVNINNQPCYIQDITTKRIKYGLRYDILAFDIFTGTPVRYCRLAIADLDVPNVLEKDYCLMGICSTFMTLKDDEGNMNTSLPIPDNECGRSLREKMTNKGSDEKVMVTLLTAMGRSKVVNVKIV